MRQLADDLDIFARRHGLRRGVEAAAVLKKTREICVRVLPPELAKCANPASYRLGTVIIEAPAGAALAILASYRQKIFQALSSQVGSKWIQRIVVRATRDADF